MLKVEDKIESYHGNKFKNLQEKLGDPLIAVCLSAFVLTCVAVGLSGNYPVNDEILSLRSISLVVGLFGLLAGYFAFREKKHIRFILLPVIILLISISLFTASKGGALNIRDYNMIAVVFSFFLLFLTLAFHEIIEFKSALISAIFLSAFLFHLVPALSVEGHWEVGTYITALDPYFYYRHADFILDTEHVPEFETRVYPTNPPDFSKSPFMVSVFMAAIASILTGFGFSLYDVAMVYPGVVAAMSVIVFYLLLRELFDEMRPYNQAAGFLGAFMLTFNSAFAVKAVAGNCEDDALGMFLLISAFLLFALAYKKKSYLFALLSGFSFMMLNMTWSGYIYAIAVFGVFAFVYSIVSFIHNRNCLEHIPYFAISAFLSLLSPIVLHAKGSLPVFTLPESIILISILSPIGTSFVLEVVRKYFSEDSSEEKSPARTDGMRFEEKIELFLEQNIFRLSAVVVVLGLVFSFAFISPVKIFDLILVKLKAAKATEIIAMTTAEQSALCSFDIFDFGTYIGCFKALLGAFGLPILLGLFMIPVLSYIILKKRSIGPVFVLSWSLPMVWGVINKSQYQFNASVPIVALGATIGLALALKKEDWESFRVIPVGVLLFSPLIVFFVSGGIPILSSVGGTDVLYRSVSSDIHFWTPTLEWFGSQPEDSVALTWWDYGHWISAISKRTSIADNTKADRFIVQDLAKFHVLVENETEALSIAKKYNATHVIIDYTMIAKSGAPHFIATSNLTAPLTDPEREGEHMGYAVCSFSPGMSQLTPVYEANDAGEYDSIREIVFSCSISGEPTEYVAAIMLKLVNDQELETYVIPVVKTKNGYSYSQTLASWQQWRVDHKGSILGVQSLNEIIVNAIRYSENPSAYWNFPTYTNLVFVPEKFNSYMMTSLYLGDHLEEYQMRGLCDPSVKKLEHFTLVEGFEGGIEDFAFGKDNSTLGYVRVYEIDYPED